MKKIILPIIAAATLTVNATDRIPNPNGADHLNGSFLLPGVWK